MRNTYTYREPMRKETKDALGWLFGALLVGLMWTAPGWLMAFGWI